MTSWTVACQVSLSITISQSLLKLMSIESVMPSNHLALCRPLLLLPSIFPRIRVFSNKLALCIRWSKYWSFSISPFNESSGLISFRIDWFYLQGEGLKPSTITMRQLTHISRENSNSKRYTCTLIFIAALFTIDKTWKQSKCPSTDKQIKKMWYFYICVIYMIEYCSAMKKE